MGGLTEHGIKKGFANQDITTKCGFHHGDVQQSRIWAANMGDFNQQRQLTLENAPSNIGIYHIYMGMSTIPEPAVS